MTGEHHPDYTAQEALDRLKQGNERFVGGTARLTTVQKISLLLEHIAPAMDEVDPRLAPSASLSALRSRPTCAGPFGACSNHPKAGLARRRAT